MKNSKNKTIVETASRTDINNHSLAIFHTDAASESKSIVIFCHGFRSSAIGPNRFFIKASRKLAEYGISSLRFDQYGSGNSEGDFLESSFDDWVSTTKSICEYYIEKGYKVALFGQSMGGSTVIVAGAQIPSLSAIVSWVPDAGVDDYDNWGGHTYHEELGQRVGVSFWQEAQKSNISHALSLITVPMYIVQCGNDEYVSAENHKAIVTNARDNHTVEMFEDLAHSQWTYDWATKIIDSSVTFIVKHMSV